MLPLIHTHNNVLDPYAVASLITLTLGSFFISSHIYERWLMKREVSLMAINAWIKGAIVLLGCTMISPNVLIAGNIYLQLSSLFAGVVMGYLFLKFEERAIRFLPDFLGTSIATNQQFSGSGNANRNIRTVLAKKHLSKKGIQHQYSYFTTSIIGAFEEILYRGFLTALCISFADITASLFYLMIITLLFALSHINIGYTHIVTKFILGLICLITFIATGSIIVAIALHSTFNFLAVKKIREYENG